VGPRNREPPVEDRGEDLKRKPVIPEELRYFLGGDKHPSAVVDRFQPRFMAGATETVPQVPK
jgi:hypothetical protein